MRPTIEAQIRDLVEGWARAVRSKNIDGILANHSPEILMFDVPPPAQSKGMEAYKKTWDVFFAWFQDSGVFDISELDITAGDDVALPLRCAGTEANGDKIELDFRLTICFRKIDERAGRSCMSITRSLPVKTSASIKTLDNIRRSRLPPGSNASVSIVSDTGRFPP
jgi:ketosteroid isomerase-like protein